MTEYEIEDLGKLIVAEVFDNQYKFGGKEKYIRDEVPAIFFKDNLLGVLVSLEGYPGLYNFKISSSYIEDTSNSVPQTETIDMSLNFFMRLSTLSDPNIKVSLGDE